MSRASFVDTWVMSHAFFREKAFRHLILRGKEFRIFPNTFSSPRYFKTQIYD